LILSLKDERQRFVMVEKTNIPGHHLLVRYLHDSHQGSCTLETDESGNVITYEEYHPFGTSSYQATNAGILSSSKRYRYVGKERDEESGLYYYGARFYAPWLCRFMSCDPKAAQFPDQSPYNYCFNNPINLIDLDGMEPEGPDDPPKKTEQTATQVTGVTAATTYAADKGTPSMNVDANNPPIQVLDEYSGDDAKKARGPVNFSTGTGGYFVNIPGNAITFPDDSGATKYIGWKDSAGKAHEYFWDDKLNAFANWGRTEIYGGKGVAIATGYASSAKLGGVINPSWFGLGWNTSGVQNHPDFNTGKNIYFGQEMAVSALPIGSGSLLFGRGTNLIGATSKQSLNFSKTQFANANINYYTRLAMDAGYSTKLAGSHVKAGLFVQMNHNIERAVVQGLGWKTLYSNSAATIMGRAWQNQAIGLGLSQIGFGIGANIINSNR
jgi:RHS repeat-associated protein